MGLETAKTGKLLYHLTALSNLESILENGLAPRRLLIENKVIFDDVADGGIISKREQLGLDIYTPFHFHPYSSFDVAVKSTYSDEDFVYICIQRDLARSNDFKILPKHPLSKNECTILDYDAGMAAIDWETLMEVGRTDDYAKHVKMAECITELVVPPECFNQIVVGNDLIKVQVEEMLEERCPEFPPPYVNIQKWF